MEKGKMTFLLALLISMLGTKASAHDIAVANGDGMTIYYNFINNNTELAVTFRGWFSQYENEYSGNVVIPDSVTYNEKTYPVTLIWGETFRYCDLTSISIPNTVTRIDQYAFWDCSGLKYVTIGNSVTCIRWQAFDGCINLMSINIPNSVTSIEGKAFNNCRSLTCVTIPNSVTSIGESAFSGCSGLKSVTIPNSVTSIGYNAFDGCSGLTSVDIPNSVTKIENNAFSGCSGLTSINIPNSVYSIGVKAFYGCTSLTDITIPNSVTSIGNSAFEGCSGLTSLTIGNSVKSIEQNMFQGCSGLTSITIGKSVESIGDGAFVDCAGLTSIIVEEGNSNYDSRDNCNAIIEKASNKLIKGSQTTIIPNSVTSIGKRAFSRCSGLTSIDIPNSVTSIEDYAFSGCSGLTSIDIPNSVTSVGTLTFSGCSGLANVNIGNSVASIGFLAFQDCSGLTNVTIPSSVTSIAEGAFRGCTNLTSIVVEDGNNKYDSRDSCNAIIETASNKLIAGCKNSVIPNTVTSIYFRAFDGCSGLTNIDIPNSVTSIGDYAFEGCSGLTSITIPNSVTSIGTDAFYNCSGLTSITIPNSVTSIGNYTFGVCSGLTSITIPNSVTSIGKSAFRGCSGLTSVTIPNSVTSIADDAFFGCSSLTSIIVEEGNSFYDSRDNCNAIIETASNKLIIGIQTTIIPNSVTSIGGGAFCECSGLTSINIPNSVTSIGNYAFYMCSGLTSVTIPNSVTSIGSRAFADCSGLTSLTVEWESPLSIPYDVFNYLNKSNITLLVPKGTKENYENASYWKDFKIVEYIPNVTIKMATNGGSPREAIGYSCEKGLDFTGVTDLKAYVATGFTDEGDVILSRVYIVPAQTGIYLASAEAGIEVTVPTTDRKVLYANLLKPYVGTGTLESSETIDGVTYKNYVVGTKDGKPSFAIWGGGTFGPHKAYMPIPESMVPAAAARAGGFSVKFVDEESTGIEETAGRGASASDALYDLQGRKVSNAKSGLYVRNGKKIIIK